MKRTPKTTWMLATITVGTLLQSSFGAPDRAQFIRECLDAAPTSQTPKFDDYTKGSYHVDKFDLVQGLEAATKSKPGQLRGVIIYGPHGPLWAYHIIVALSEGDMIRLNSLVVPHARITSKGTQTLSTAEFALLTNKLVSSKLLREGDPPSEDFGDFLVAVWSDGKRSIHLGELRKAEAESQQDVKALMDAINTVLDKVKITYPKEENRKGAKTK